MANNGMPSLIALLGLAAVAGYQNRDKIAGAIRDAQDRRNTPGAATSPLDSILGGIGDLVSGSGLGGGNVLSGGLGDLIDRFKQAGQGDTADSWVTPGVPTRGLTPAEVEQAIGRDNLGELSRRTGLSHDELLKRLATAIPETVDHLTPGGRMPTEDDARRHFGLA
jgi:uncharacterized protein YidB (DUF937 family)